MTALLEKIWSPDRKAKAFYAAATLVECLLLILAAVSILKSGSFSYQFQRLSGETEESFRLTTEQVPVPAGIYTVTAVYQPGRGEGVCKALAMETGVYSLFADDIRLPSVRSQKEFAIYVNYDVPDLRFQVTSNDPEFVLTGLRLTTAWNSRLYQIFRVFVPLLAINLALLALCFSRHRNGAAFIVVLIGGAASLGVFTEYLPYGHDLLFHLLRIEGVKDGWLSGAFPVRIQPNWNNGYGYAVSVLYGEVLLYFPALLRLIGVTVQTAYKCYVVAVNILTAGTAYYAFRQMCGDKKTALFGSCLYTLAPWRLSCLYTRAAVGEYSAPAFLPLAALAFWYAVNAEDDEDFSWKKLLLPVIGFSGLLQTHILTCLMSVVLILVFCAVTWRKILRKNTFFYLCKVAGVTVLLNLWFLVPWCAYMREPFQGTAMEVMTPDFTKMGANPAELLAPYWNGTLGYGWAEIQSLATKFPKPLGWGFAVVFLLALLLFYKRKVAAPHPRNALLLCTGLFVLSTAMGTSLFPYWPLYRVAPFAANFIAKIRIPCRFLTMAGLFGAMLAVLLVKPLRAAYGKKTAVWTMAAVAALSVWQGAQFIYSNLYRGDCNRYYDIAVVDSTYTIGNEYFYWDTQNWLTDQQQTPTGNNVEITGFAKRYTTLEVACRSLSADSSLEVPLFYYPGYVAYDKNEPQKQYPVERGGNNRVRVLLPAEQEGTVVVTFREPLLWKAAGGVTLLTILVLLLLFVRRNRPRKERLPQEPQAVMKTMKFSFEKPNLPHKTVRRVPLRPVLWFTVAALLAELFLFNFRHWESLGNKVITDYQVTVGDGLTAQEDGTFLVDEGEKTIEFTGIDQRLNTLYFDIEDLSQNDPNARTMVYQKVRDDGHELYQWIPDRELCHAQPKSQYLTYHFYGNCKSLKLTLSTGNGHRVRLRYTLNPVIPLFFSPARLGALWCLLLFLYLFRPASPVYSIVFMERKKLRYAAVAVFLATHILLAGALVRANPFFRGESTAQSLQYQELAEAFSQGQTSLLVEPPQALIDMENPYDMEYRDQVMRENGVYFQWDHAYYNGRYYVYFGVVPEVLFFFPYYLLTGEHLHNHQVIFVQAVVMLVALTGILYTILKRWFPKTSLGAWYMLSETAALSCGLVYMCKRPDIYTVPIITGLALGLMGLWLFLTAERRENELSLPHIALGSLCMALIAGSRPQLFLIVLLPLALLAQPLLGVWRASRKKAAACLLAFAVPMCLVAAALMAYNFVRFGSIFDFGANYNLTMNDMRYRGFSLDRIPLGLFSYFLAPLRITLTFPFLAANSFDSNYLGVTIWESNFGGAFVTSLFIWMCPALVVFRKQVRENRLAKVAFLSMAVSVVIVIADTQMAGLLPRYLNDVLIFLVLAAMLAWLLLFEKCRGGILEKPMLVFLVASLLGAAVYQGFALFVDTGESLMVYRPDLFAWVKYQVMFWL